MNQQSVRQYLIEGPELFAVHRCPLARPEIHVGNGEQRKLHHVAIEIRQNLITGEAGQRMWAALFVRLLPKAYQRLIHPQGHQMKLGDSGA
jgi:hypothetical protein